MHYTYFTTVIINFLATYSCHYLKLASEKESISITLKLNLTEFLNLTKIKTD